MSNDMTTALQNMKTTLATHNEVARWADPTTGRTVRQLTDVPTGASVSYFRFPRHVPGGWILAWGKHETGSMLLIDPDSGEVRPVAGAAGSWGSKLRESDGTLMQFRQKGNKHERNFSEREVVALNLLTGEEQSLGMVPDEAPGMLMDVSADGKTALLTDVHQDIGKYPIPRVKEVDVLWRYFNRPRHGSMWTCDLATGKATRIYESFGVCPLHMEFHPTDPGLVRFCLDMFDAYGQRIWTVRADGSDLHKIRPQEFGELVTHEFWWSDPRYIGYTYQDRRTYSTLNTLPWAEYSPMPTQLGIANLAGEQLYLSDPLESYHSHLYCSADGRYVCGEGTHSHSFAYAGRFDLNSSALKLVPMATINAPYVPFRGQHVETGFSIDSRWLMFNQLLGENYQVCAVEVDF